MLNKSANAGRHSFADRGDDLYETPVCATLALLKVEMIPESVWEPACGRGAISKVLLENGCFVWSTDINDYGYGQRADFFKMRKHPDIDSVNVAIVSNPPYRLADQFVRHALTLCPNVIMLLRLAFLEGSRRSDIIDGGNLARVYVFRNRLPMMHRDGWQGGLSTNTMAFGWFVWDRHHHGPTKLHRVTWKPPGSAIERQLGGRLPQN